MSDSDPVATYSYAISELSKRKIALLHFIEKMMGDQTVHVTTAQARSWFKGPLAVNGGYTKQRAEEVLSTEAADLVAIGVPFIANPDLVERFKRDAPLNEPDTSTFYGGNERGYTDYPTKCLVDSEQRAPRPVPLQNRAADFYGRRCPPPSSHHRPGVTVAVTVGTHAPFSHLPLY